MSEQEQENAEQAAMERAQAVRRAHEEALLARPNVVGVGVGLVRRGGALTGEVGIVVMVAHKLPPDALDPADRIPAAIEGVPVDVQEVGEIRAH